MRNLLRERESGFRKSPRKRGVTPYAFWNMPVFEPSFFLFVHYFLSRLQGNESVDRVVDIFQKVIASLSYREFGGSPPPGRFVTLSTLPWEEKERYYRRFPMLARRLFPERTATKLIAEFHRLNRISDGAVKRKEEQH